MKHPLVQLIQLLVFVSLSNLLMANNPGKDFLITLNGSKLTGNITSVSVLNGKIQLSFQNDFGDKYTIHPATVYGFAFAKEGEILLYESKQLDGRWKFLKVETQGQKVCLYTSAERQLKYADSNGAPILVEEKNPQNWIQFQGEQPVKIYRLNYRRILKKKMKAYPDLVNNIGKKGFRYRNLLAIIDLYNRKE